MSNILDPQKIQDAESSGSTSLRDQLKDHPEQVDQELAGIEKATKAQEGGGGGDRVGRGFVASGSGGKGKGLLQNKFLARFGIVGVALSVIFGILSILQGPFQFIMISQLLSRFHFSTIAEFGDDRTGKFLLYSLMGRRAEGRLSVAGNYIANSYEKKLNNKGLKSVYNSNGRLIGYEILDAEKAKDILRELESQDGVNRGNFDGRAIGEGKNTSRVGVHWENSNFSQRRDFRRIALKNLDITKMSSIIGSRTMIKRDGVNFHPLNRLRQKFDSDADKKRKIQDDHESRIDGTSPDGEISPRRKRINDAFEKINRVASKLKGPALVVGITCTLKDFSGAVNDRAIENNKALLRIGMDKITTGSQVMSGQDIDFDTLGVLNEMHYDPETETSFFADPGFRAEDNKSPDTPDLTKDLAIRGGSYNKPALLDIIDSVPTEFSVLGPVGDAINILPGSPFETPKVNACSIDDLVSSFIDPIVAPFQDAIYSVLPFTPEDLQNIALDFVAGQAVESARGSRMGGLSNIGARLASGSQARGMGGVAMTAEEEQELRIENQDIHHEKFASLSVFERYFSVYNSQSLAANALMSLPSSNSQVVGSIHKIPMNIFGSLFGAFGLQQKVSAQSTYNYGFASYGFSVADKQDAAYENPHENERLLYEEFARRVAIEEACHAEGKHCPQPYSSIEELNTGKELTDPHDDVEPQKANGESCFSMALDDEGNMIYGEARDITEVPGECKEQRDISFMRYRFYMADTHTAHSLACFEGRTESCSQIGFNGSGSTSGGVGTLPSGDAQELARAILDSPNINVSSAYVSQLEGISQGTGPCPNVNSGNYQVDTELLRVILGLGETNTFSISSLHRGCTSSSVGSGSRSRHWRGKAVDISGSNPINGVTMPNFAAHDPEIQRFVNEARQLLPAGCELGVPNSRYISGAISLGSLPCTKIFLDTPSTTKATGPHVHLGVP